MINVESFAKLLQFSISPVILISAVGLLLLTLTNRLGRAIDRARALALERQKTGVEDGFVVQEQLRVLIRRCEILRTSIALIICCVLFSCLMILALFVMTFTGIRTEWTVLTCLGMSILSLLGGVLYFYLDIHLVLKALKMEIGRYSPL